MKKNELTDLIREIVSEEIRRELPNAIAEVFANVMGKKQPITDHVDPKPRSTSHPQAVEEPHKESLFKRSLKEMFDGTPVIHSKQHQGPKKFAKDPTINEILNQTRPFTSQERTGASIGMAAMMAAVNNTNPMASPAMPMMEEEPSYLRNVPSLMPTHHTPIAAPTSQAELLNDNHIPMADLPEGVSVLDLTGAVGQAAPSVAEALTRDYSKFMKLVDKKKGKI